MYVPLEAENIFLFIGVIGVASERSGKASAHRMVDKLYMS